MLATKVPMIAVEKKAELAERNIEESVDVNPNAACNLIEERVNVFTKDVVSLWTPKFTVERLEKNPCPEEMEFVEILGTVNVFAVTNVVEST